MAAQNEDPLSTETAPRSSLLDLIFKHQGTDPLCIQLKKELRQPDSDQSGSRWLKASDEGASLKGYTLDQQGILYYRGRVLVPQQKALIQELLYLYYDDQFTGH